MVDSKYRACRKVKRDRGHSRRSFLVATYLRSHRARTKNKKNSTKKVRDHRATNRGSNTVTPTGQSKPVYSCSCRYIRAVTILGRTYKRFVCGRFRPLRSLTRKNGTEQTVQTSRCKHAIRKCQELHAPSRKTTRTPPACTYVHTYFLLSICTKKRKHRTAQHRIHNENAKEEMKKKNTCPLRCNYFPPEAACAGQKKNEQQNFSQPCTLLAPLATTSPPIRSG